MLICVINTRLLWKSKLRAVNKGDKAQSDHTICGFRAEYDETANDYTGRHGCRDI